MTDIKLSDIDSLLPPQWFGDLAMPIDKTAEFRKTIEDFRTFLRSDSGRGIRGDLRTTMDRFVHKNGYIPAGGTNVNPMGTYIVGTKPSNKDQLGKLAQRELGERLFADAVVAGINETLTEMEFTHRDDEDYQDRRSALLAHELESLSSKGPYDNGTEDQGLKTIGTILENSYEVKPIDPMYNQAEERAYNYLFKQYKGNADIARRLDPTSWVLTMKEAGLAKTMRGLPYHGKGNAPVQQRHYDFMAWMIEPVAPNFKYKRGTFKDYLISYGKEKPTIDHHIQDCMTELLLVLKLKPTQIVNMRMLLETVISRNQGSPWIIGYEDGKYITTDDRKDMKFRAVVPAPALPQAILLLASRPIVKSAPKLAHRIGLQTPELNESRLNAYIRDHAVKNLVGISTDFSSYDIKLPSPYMARISSLYSMVLEDPLAKDAMLMGAIVLGHKVTLFPTYPTDHGHAYDKHPYEFLYEIKGARNHNLKKVMKDTSNAELRAKMEEQSKEFDFIARAFYVFKTWLISGIIVTNTIGSDATTELGGYLVPEYFFQKGIITFEEREAMIAVIASGDDAVNAFPKRLYDELGFDKVLKLLEEAYDYFNMIVHAKKQLRTRYRGYPVYDFLQQVKLPMWDDVADQPPYRKFVRQVMAIPYNERESKLDRTFQWVSPIGKLESGLCAENVDFAAKVIVTAGRHIYERAREKGYQPPVPPHLYGSRDKLIWDKQYAVNNSPLLGLGQLIGLVKKYRQGTISALGKYLALEAVGDAVGEIESELETRAPHRAQIAASIFASLGADAFREAGGFDRFDVGGAITHWYFVDVLTKVDELTGGIVQEVVLEKQESNLTSIPDGVETGDNEDLEIPEETNVE